MNHETLRKTFDSLPVYLQSALEVLSVIYEPMARSPAMEIVSRAGIRHPSGRALVFADWKLVVGDLVEKGILVQDGHKIQCNPDFVETITRNADRKGNLKRWMEAVDVSLRRRDYSNRHYFNDYESLEVFTAIRTALHGNEPDKFLNILSTWKREHSRHELTTTVIQRLLNQPFDGDWLYSRAPAIRDAVILELIRHAHDNLLPAVAHVDLLLRIARDGDLGDSSLDVAIEHDLLAGRIDDAEARLSVDAGASRQALRGWACFLRGERKLAASHFEAAIKSIRKETRKRAVVLTPTAGAFYVLALVGTGDVNLVRKAHGYIDLASKKLPGTDPLQAALRSAARLAEGKVDLAKSLVGSIGSAKNAPPIHQLFIFTVLCWIDPAAVRKHCRDLAALQRRAEQGNYMWVALELSRLIARAKPEHSEELSDTPIVDGAAIVPLLDSVREEPPWARSLKALEQLSNEGPAGAHPSGSRLTWRVSVGKGSARVEPVEQRLGATGRWTKGRPVALKRLHERNSVEHLSSLDINVCKLIEAESSGYYGQVNFNLPGAEALAALVDHPLVFRLDDPDTKVAIVEQEPQLRVVRRKGHVTISLVPEVPEVGNVIAVTQSSTRVSVTRFTAKHHEIFAVLRRGGLKVPVSSKDMVARAVSAVSSLVTVHSDIVGSDADAIETVADPMPQFLLTPYEDGLRVQPVVRPFADEGPAYPPGEGGKVVLSIAGGQRVRTQRDLKDERRRHDEAVSSCPTFGRAAWDEGGWILPSPNDCLELLEELHLLGDTVRLAWPSGETIRISHRASLGDLSLKIRRAQDWFGIDGHVQLDSGLVMSLRELLDQVQQARGRFLPIGDKGFVALSERFRKRIDELAAFAVSHGKGIRFHPTRAHALAALLEDTGAVDVDRHWTERIERFRQSQSLDPCLPSTLQAELRDYQLQGFQWAARLAAWGVGACLADDMGLGKTVQALAVALSRAPEGPTLVVAPTSVCSNWVDESRKFTPTLNAFQFGQGNRLKMLQGLGPFDVMVCSYGLLHQEADGLASKQWQTVILDEAQAIKNRETMRSQAAMRLEAGFRLITTGTPIENHLGELWNLFNFINPGLLGSADGFARDFAAPIHQQGSSGAKSRLKRLIQPFILRRTKTAVLEELPSRTEITLRIEMSREERSLYEAVRARAVDALDAQESGAETSHVKILAEITRLRRACCHPQLVMPEAEIAGSKLEKFMEMITELIDNGHKALVFSQFVSHLEIVRAELDAQGVRYRYLVGATPARDRKREVDAFQAGAGDLFLISLRAGGQGLNLTAADFVFHLDPWWNPAVEDQASDRAHRIGQTRPVTIYRLVMKSTIEEKIVDMHKSKRDLADNLLAGADMSGKISADELLALIRDA